jgi:putative membrane protein
VRALLENKLIPGLTNAQDLLADANKIDLDGLLSSTAQTVTNAIDMLEKYEKEMPALGQEIHDANVMLNGHMDEIVDGINKGVSLYQNELPELTAKLNKAADFVVNDWPTLKNEVTSTLDTVHEKLPTVESALDMAAGLIEDEWPSLKNGVHKAATAIHKGEEIADLGDIIKLLKNDAQAESDFFTTPVELKTTTMYPIENNGSASTPFYTALCLWVGALLLSSVAGTTFHLEGEDKKRFSKREMFVARMMTFLTFAIGQALIVTLGNYFALGVDVREPVYSILFGLLVALAFMMMIYVFVGLFGNVGKGIGIILLVLSISGGGGNYPIQVSGPFFQFIHPLLPFTYAVNLLRESAGGIYWPNATLDLWILGGIFVVFGIIGTVLCPFMVKPMARVEELAHKSHFFH